MPDGQVTAEQKGRADVPARADVVIVGAGFSGIYLVHLFRRAGIDAVVLEAGSGVGGTWYWNRYPGARCDIESMQYSHKYLPGLEQEWDWSERYAAQPEILDYANEIADRLDVRRDMCFGRRVTEAVYDEAAHTWTLTADTGETITAPFCIMATGCLSVPNEVRFEGRDSFTGPTYTTGLWPHGGVDFTGQRVAVIGTGSSAIQSIPEIADQAEEMWVFQRTPNYVIPAHNGPMDPAYRDAIKADYAGLRARQRVAFSAADFNADPDKMVATSTAAEIADELERRWQVGGLGFMACFADVMFSEEANAVVAEFVRGKIREIVDDPETAELLCPDNTIGCKRLCVDTGYFQTFNRPNVHLVSIKNSPVERITPSGVVTGGKEYPVDTIVYATGFDAMTGALNRIDIRGRDGRLLRDKWAEGPKSLLGLAIEGFPNLFTVTGPGSPSVFTNMIPSIEHHCEWIAGCIGHLRGTGRSEIEATGTAEEQWVAHNAEVAGKHLRSSCSSWYTGENIAGKPTVFMPYIGGFPGYVDHCDALAEKDYEGFSLR